MSDTATGRDNAACDDASSAACRMTDELERLRAENARLVQQLQQQQQQRETMSTNSPGGDSTQLDFIHAQQELSRCKEALLAMKADRKRLTSEKADLVSQMKQLYGTLKDKECELRDFIRNYEQRNKDNNDLIKQLGEDKERLERDRQNAVTKCQMLGDQLSAVQNELAQKNDFVAQLKRLLTQTKLPVDVTSLSSIHHLASCIDTSSHDNCNDSLLLSTSAVNTTLSVDDLPPYHEMFSSSAVPPPAAARTGSVSLSETPLKPSSNNYRKKLLAQRRASQLAASLSHQSGAAEWRHNSFTGTATTSSGVYSTLSSHDSRATPRRRTASFLVHRGSTENKLATLEQAHRLPVRDWKASHVLAWLDVDMNMADYGQACFDNIKSGKILLGLSDAELESALRLESSLHRRKMRLAIEELRDPATVQYPNASKLDHHWVANEWLDCVGLPQYSGVFETKLIDARLLNILSKKDLDKHLNIHNKFHQSSILHGVQLLRMMRFDTQALQERRDRCQDVDNDIIVWTNQRLKQWAYHVDLQEYADKLDDSGVHGAVLLLDSNFTADMMANLLAIPTSKSYVRRHLVTEYDVIVQQARSSGDCKKTSAATSGRSSVVIRSQSGGRAATANLDSSLTQRNSARRLSFKGSLVRALRGRSLSKELPSLPPPAPSLSSASATTVMSPSTSIVS